MCSASIIKKDRLPPGEWVAGIVIIFSGLVTCGQRLSMAGQRALPSGGTILRHGDSSIEHPAPTVSARYYRNVKPASLSPA